MALKPWHTVMTPREDLRENKPLDASEFAVHLDKVRDESAPDVYRKPTQFFERTYLTKSLTELSAEVVRRLSGIKTETSAVFNMTTQFGGGKTHALTLLYHLANGGPEASKWVGVSTILARAGVEFVPKAIPAIFVGTEFDSLQGRGGNDGTPLRKTPWGEIAYQLSGAEGLAAVAEHEKLMTAPGGDVIRLFIPKDRPCLILMDELMNYVSRSRKSGMATQLFNFLQNLSEFARGCDNVVLAVSIPASEMEMSQEDHADYDRLKKVLDRLGKAIMMSEETEISEIIRRRLFEWDEKAVSQDGKVLLNKEALATCKEYANWAIDHRQQLPNWFPVDNAQKTFADTYPFHPMALSVFERKWQALPRFQRTRGVLRLLALWVANAYADSYTGAQKDPLIGLGTAPLDDPNFRAAMLEQLGEDRWEAAITTDICGKQDSHAVRLDKESVDTIKKARLHRKVATTIFFESNGGQARAEATLPELRLAVADPSLDIGNVETVLDDLTPACYYLSVEKNRYRFSLSPNLNKLLADRRASIKTQQIEQRVCAEVQKVFTGISGVDIVPFPTKSNEIPDRAALTFVVLSPEQSIQDASTLPIIDSMTKESGASARTFKSALIWCVADSATSLQEEARKVLAWEDIRDVDMDSLDEGQKRQLNENLPKAQRDLKESVWRTYRHVVMLGKDNTLRTIDMGLVHSSASSSLTTLILQRLRQDGDVEESISPNFLVRNWAPAFKEWPTKSVRNAFFASPQFPRLLSADAVKDTIATGTTNGKFAYVAKTPDGGYDPFVFGKELNSYEVEISDDVFIITKETAEAHLSSKADPVVDTTPEPSPVPIPSTNVDPVVDSGPSPVAEPSPIPVTEPALPTKMTWEGQVPAQKWTNFYTKVLSKHVLAGGLTVSINIEVAAEGGISKQKIEETKAALRDLGLADDVETSTDG